MKAFQPYDRTQEVNEEARKAGAGMIVERERCEPRQKTYICVNNRLEGNALETINAMLERSSLSGAEMNKDQRTDELLQSTFACVTLRLGH